MPTISPQRELHEYLKPLEAESRNCPLSLGCPLLPLEDPCVNGGNPWKEMETGLMRTLSRAQIAGTSPSF